MLPKNEIEQELDELENDRKTFQKELDIEKQRLIQTLKGINKDDLIPKPEKLTIWQRLKKVINI
jgi:hypothetical protein